MVERLVDALQVKIYADCGYTSQELKSKLLKEQCVDLITYHRKNMNR